jgi:glutamate racemase
MPLAVDSRRLPIAVFDSGIGGLTVLRALRRELPREPFI